MNCPNCGQEYFCPCDSCKEHSPHKQPKMIRVNYVDGDNWDEQCPKCGLTKSVHWWFELQGEYYQKRKANNESKT